jgi:hypothetical protein
MDKAIAGTFVSKITAKVRTFVANISRLWALK